MDPEQELILVRRAITCGLSNCCDWVDRKASERIRNDPDLQGFTPEGIKELLIDHVKGGGEIRQRVEEREPYRFRREFWYMAIIPVDCFPRGLFVEMELLDHDGPDDECPVVVLLNAHRERA